MQFLGLTNYCRSWFPDYAALTQPLLDTIYTDDMTMTGKIQWTPAADNAFEATQRCLVGSSVLALPEYDKPWEQYPVTTYEKTVVGEKGSPEEGDYTAYLNIGKTY